MKRPAAIAITLSMLLLAAWLGSRTRDSAPAQFATPWDCINGMFRAASDGDLDGYLGCFSDAQRQQIERSLGGETESAAVTSLRASVGDLKGWALAGPLRASPGAAESVVVVERIYANRVDRQRMELRKERQGWRIVRVERPQPAQPPIAYGTPIYAAEPEEGKQP